MTVPERMLSLAIGREGQNARLAARLTGWRIDIRSDVAAAEAAAPRRGRAPPRPPRPRSRHRPSRRRRAGRRGRRRSRGAGSRGRRGRGARRGRGRSRRTPKKRATKAKAASRRGSRRDGRGTRRRARRGAAPRSAPGPRRRPPAEAASANGDAEAVGRDAGRQAEARHEGGPRGGVVVAPATAGRSRPAAPRPVPSGRCVACRTPAPSGSSSGSFARRAVRWCSTRPAAPGTRRLPVPRTPTAGRPAGRRRALEHALGAAVPDDLAATLAAGPDALGSTTENTTTGAPSDLDAGAPTNMNIEGGPHGQE